MPYRPRRRHPRQRGSRRHSRHLADETEFSAYSFVMGFQRVVLGDEHVPRLQRYEPRILRPASGPIRVYLPYRKENRQWLGDTLPELTRKRFEKSSGAAHWAIAASHTDTLLGAITAVFGSCLYVHAEKSSGEKCDTRCRDASPDSVHECVCKGCQGLWHGTDNPNWINPSGTFLVSPGQVGYYAELWGNAEAIGQALGLPDRY